MRPAGAGIRELCADSGCTDREIRIMVLLADGCSIDQIAAELLISHATAWAERRSAKRKIREQYGLDPDDREYEVDVELRKAQIIRMHFRGYGLKSIASRLGLQQTTVKESISLWYAKHPDLESRTLRGRSERYDDWAVPSSDGYDGRDDFIRSSGKSRRSREAQTHWASSTGIDPFLPPGAAGGPPVHPMTVRKVGEDG